MKKYVVLLAVFLHNGLVVCSGSLDTNFSRTGIVTFVAPGVTGDCMGQGMSLSHDNELIFGGYGSINGTNGIMLAKYHRNGSLNTAFGNNGIVLTDPSSAVLLSFTGVPYNWNVVDIKVNKSTRKIIVAASVIDRKGGDKNKIFCLASYNPDGSSDALFGTLVAGSLNEKTGFLAMQGLSPYALAVQPDGKIIIGGSSSGDNGNNVFALARFNSNGTRDEAFGKNAIVEFSSILQPAQQYIYGIAIQADGKIVTTGFVNKGDLFAIVTCRFNIDGSLDKTFNTRLPLYSGYVIAHPGGSEFSLAFAVTVQPDQKIVVAGYVSVPVAPTAANNNALTNLNLLLLRYNQDGSIDKSFGSAGTGMVLTKAGEWGMMPFAVSVQSDGKIVVAGQSTSYDEQGLFDRRFATVRFNTNGLLDTTFGFDRTGIVKTPFLDGQAIAKGLVLYENKIAVGGYAMDSGRGFNDSVIVQYNQ